MTVNELKDLLSSNESELLEFKTDWFDKDGIGEYISALANSAALKHQKAGYLIWGVDDKTHQVVGTKMNYDRDIDNEPFQHYLSRNLSPANFDFEEFTIDGKRVVVLSIYASRDVPTDYRGERYIRIGSSKEKLRRYHKVEARLWKALNDEEWSLVNEPSPRAGLTFEVFKISLIENGNTFTDDNFYQNNHMLTKEGQLNWLAYMVSDQFDISLKVSTFAGENKRSELISRKELGGGCIFKSIDRVVDYMNNIVNTMRSYFDPGKAKRRDEYLFDQDSFREAYINAVLHNDWSTKSGPSVFVFSNHLEIYSHGSPLTVQSKEGFLKGNSIPLNPDLAKVFMKVDKFEESGRGVNTIVNFYGPKAFIFSDDNSTFTVRIDFNPLAIKDAQKVDVPVNVSENVSENVPENVPEKSVSLVDSIISLIKNNPKISQAKLAERLGKNRKAIQRAITSSGRIVHVGPDKGGYWKIVDEEGEGK